MEINLTDEQIYKTLDLVCQRYCQIDMDETGDLSFDRERELMLLSKLSLIEFCGWVEITVDEILKNYLARSLISSPVSNQCEEEIDNVYGCSNENVQRLFRRILGGWGYSRLLARNAEFQMILSHVEAIAGKEVLSKKRKRDIAAHTPMDPLTQTYFSAPSLVLDKLRKVHPLLLRLRTDVLNF